MTNTAKPSTYTRSEEINHLYEWGMANTNLSQISLNHAIIFSYSDIENIPKDLIYVYDIFQKLLERTKTIFHIGNYTASEYAMAVILIATKGIDVPDIYNKIIQNTSTLIHPTLSNAAKIQILQKIISEMNNNQIDTNELIVIERLTQKEGFSELDAKDCIIKALKMGAITKTELGLLSI